MSTPTPEYYRKQIPVSKEDIERGYVEVDPYRIARLWELNDPALFQAFKKVLCGGQRGGKDKQQDAKEARDAISRWLELEEVEEETEVLEKAKYWIRKSDYNVLVKTNDDIYFWSTTVSGKDPWTPEGPKEAWEHLFTSISEAEARALVEKAGGVW